MVSRTFAIPLAAAVCLAALAAGCGGGGGGLAATGGGGGGGPNPPRPPPPPPPDLSALAASYRSHSDYRAVWGLEQIRAAEAYARIAGRDGAGARPGKDARVAVIDDGIDDKHWEFEKLTIRETCHATQGCGSRTHGTAVSSVIAARRDSTLTFSPHSLAQYNFHGVAWGLDRLQVLSIRLGSASGSDYSGVAVAAADDAVHELAGLFSALQQPVDFVNMSFGYQGLIENYRGKTFEQLWDPAVRTLAQTGKATGKTILVMAAGNAHGAGCASPEPNCVNGLIDAASPELYPGLPVLEASLRSHMVAVAETDSSGAIASFSNRCGIAAKWCIAAPGDWMWLALYDAGPPEDRGYAQSRGTSFAAPHVTGGLAVMKHWFRSQLANEKLLERLYLTARVTPDPVSAHGGTCPDWLDTDGDTSDCELSSELGRGLMDLGAATAPVGSTSIALGDALSRSLAGRRIALFDELGAPFWTDAAGFAGRTAGRSASARAGWRRRRRFSAPARKARSAGCWRTGAGAPSAPPFRRRPRAGSAEGRSGSRCNSRSGSRADISTSRCPSAGRRTERYGANGCRSASNRRAARSISASTGRSRPPPARPGGSGLC